MYKLGRNWNSCHSGHSEIEKQTLNCIENIFFEPSSCEHLFKFKSISFFIQTSQEILGNSSPLCLVVTIGSRPFRLSGNDSSACV